MFYFQVNKFVKYFVFLLGLNTPLLFAQHTAIPHDKMPIPPASSTRLFYVQRSPNTNTIIYEANLLPNKKLNPEEPINTYWIRYGEKGQKQSLNYIQRTMAYGIETMPFPNEVGVFEGRIVSYKKRRLKILVENGVPVALTTINGKLHQLLKVFVMIEETGHLIPKVLYIELFGKDLKTGAEVYEKFKP